MRTDPVDPGLRSRAVAAARGREPFDLLITGGTVVDVGTGELRPADVGVVGPLIASVHETGTRSDATDTHDAAGRFVTPGFFDTHVHFESSMLTPGAYAEAVLPHGTTTVFIDPHELGNVAGLDGVRYAIEASRGLPVRFLVQAPSCVPPMPGLELSGADFGGPEVEQMLAWPEVAGVAEVMDMLGVLEGAPRMTDIVGAGLRAGKLVSGHAYGLYGAELQAYLTSGITSDHELFGAGDVVEKLRAGMTIELRYNLPFFFPELVQELNKLPLAPPHLCTASDDIFAKNLLEDGHINILLRLLIELGLDPVFAIRCATLNGAYRVQRSDLGLVGPGRRADLVVLSDLERVVVDDVFTDGVLRASGGRVFEPVVEAPSFPPTDTMRVGALNDDDFVLRVPGAPDGPATVRVVSGQVFTCWDEATVEVRDGTAQIPDGHLLQVAIHRFGRAPAEPKAGLISGWGELTGAVATSVAHDTHNLVVFGRDPRDMALAANSVIASGGGVAVASGGEILAAIALPIAGLLSPLPPHEVAEQQGAVEDALQAIGLEVVMLPSRLLTITVSSLACLPGPHVTDVGLVDGNTNERVDLLVLS